ncbi:MAG: DUF1732 domain-containing protein [Candidatus Omnitrophica bacterium]|nr:DUF1732 domain-containing protein [Candidatus Omnitrophota bacterium]MCM8831287.1 DUF1732 domain-containing protein [Candidatus Omnitrophota bacterium]
MRSMTAYGHVYKRKSSQTLHLVLRSLNFKYLDISVKGLIPENIILEELIKKIVAKKIYRGKIEIYLFFKSLKPKNIYINENILKKYILSAKQIAKKYKLEFKQNVTDFLNLPEVVLTEEKHHFDKNFVISTVKEGLNKLLIFKEHCGNSIEKQIIKNLKSLKTNILEIKKFLRTKKLDNINETGNKEDIEEEISLSLFYIKKLEKIVSSKKNEPKGKSLDFLTQEILRELNSASSKIVDKKFALLLVDSKKYVDRIREQAQNVE